MSKTREPYGPVMHPAMTIKLRFYHVGSDEAARQAAQEWARAEPNMTAYRIGTVTSSPPTWWDVDCEVILLNVGNPEHRTWTLTKTA